MKKNLLLFFVLMLYSGGLWAQNFELKHEGKVVTNNQVFEFNGPETDEGIIKFDFENKNGGAYTLTVDGTTLEDHIPTVCVPGNCYPVGDLPWTSSPFTTSGELSVHILPSDVKGQDELTYTINALGESISFKVKWTFGKVGIKETPKLEVKNAFPNPCTKSTTISYDLKSTKDAKVVIYNLTGKIVKEVELGNIKGEQTINTSDLKSGIYLYSFIADNVVACTHKLIVNK